MGHILLVLYLLTGLVGRGGVVLCIEENADLSWETILDSCCEQLEDTHEQLAHESETLDSLCPGECLCVDLPVSLQIQHRLDGAGVAPTFPALLPCVQPLAAEAPFPDQVGETFHHSNADRGRPDLPGAGASPLILRT